MGSLGICTGRYGLLRRSASSLRSLTSNRGLLTLSHVQGPTQPPLIDDTLTAYFENELLTKYASRPALICKKERPRPHGGPTSRNLGRSDNLAWDFEEFHGHIQALARGLVALGVKKGDRVGVVMGNNRCVRLARTTEHFCTYIIASAYASLQWACASIGAILVTINPAYRVKELVSDNVKMTNTLFYSVLRMRLRL